MTKHIGLLKDWLTKALDEALETGAKTITPALLEQYAIDPSRCDQMMRLPRFGGAREGEIYYSTKGETINGERATSLSQRV